MRSDRSTIPHIVWLIGLAPRRQGRYLVEHSPELSMPYLAAIAALNIGGYLIFRGANSQKVLPLPSPLHAACLFV